MLMAGGCECGYGCGCCRGCMGTLRELGCVESGTICRVKDIQRIGLVLDEALGVVKASHPRGLRQYKAGDTDSNHKQHSTTYTHAKIQMRIGS